MSTHSLRSLSVRRVGTNLFRNFFVSLLSYLFGPSITQYFPPSQDISVPIRGGGEDEVHGNMHRSTGSSGSVVIGSWLNN